MLTLTPQSVRLSVRVQPRAARDRVLGPRAGRLTLQVTAPPVGGAANRAAADLVADWLDLPRRAIRTVQGQTGRDKLLEIAGDDPAALLRRVELALAALR